MTHFLEAYAQTRTPIDERRDTVDSSSDGSGGRNIALPTKDWKAIIDFIERMPPSQSKDSAKAYALVHKLGVARKLKAQLIRG